MTETVVVYIAGYGRSGSTLLDLLLGRNDGWLSMGEFRLFLYAARDHWICGCGSEVLSCPIWSSVVPVATGGDVAGAVADLKASARLRRVPGLMRPYLLGAHRNTVDRFVARIGDTYRAAAAASGARVLVDSSKDPIYGLLLRRTPGVRLHVIHLVRDSRAVAWSWLRKKPRPEIASSDEYMPTRSILQTSLEWDLRNGLAHVLGREAASYTRLTYESMVENPASVAQEIWRLVETSRDSITSTRFDDDFVNHTVGGNPMRFTTKALEVKPDLEWRASLGSSDRRMVTALTWPLLRHYHYQ